MREFTPIALLLSHGFGVSTGSPHLTMPTSVFSCGQSSVPGDSGEFITQMVKERRARRLEVLEEHLRMPSTLSPGTQTWQEVC